MFSHYNVQKQQPMGVHQCSKLNGNLNYDYTDSFSCNFSDIGHSVTATDVAKAFFSCAPKWVQRLMAIRDAAVGLMGLKTSGSNGKRSWENQHFQCEPGEQMGRFRVLSKTENELVLGQDDRHLNFRLTLLIAQIGNASQKRLTIHAAVKFNNFFGCTYFAVVRPFHRLIVPSMLKKICKTLEAREKDKLEGRR